VLLGVWVGGGGEGGGGSRMWLVIQRLVVDLLYCEFALSKLGLNC